MTDYDLIDILDQLKARRAWRQLSFWASLVPLVMFLLPTEARNFITAHWGAMLAASGPFIAWLAHQGITRYGAVRAAGTAAAAAMPEIARTAAVYGKPITPPAAEQDAPDEMHDDAGKRHEMTITPEDRAGTDDE